ncbi:MAG TPA: DUF982 domain-containing protein [Mesorhizobium sp.]|jgi:hypothetical protein|nr:DUF982 domain-containing protein [Mesorhizobium sp.]
MGHGVFESPVRIYVGLHFAREVGSVGEALVVLTEWPHHRRGPEHRIAMRAAQAALAGEIEAETVRSTFAAFAKKSGILAPEVDAIVAAAKAGKPAEARAI